MPHSQPRTQTHTFCKPAQSKCMSTFHTSHFMQKFNRKNAAPQNLGPHFVRACAAEMHVNISQEPLYEKFTGKMPRLRVSPERGHTLCASLRFDMHVNISQEPLSTEIYRKNAARQSQPRTQTHTLREPAQSECMSAFHKSRFCHNLQEKCRRPE